MQQFGEDVGRNRALDVATAGTSRVVGAGISSIGENPRRFATNVAIGTGVGVAIAGTGGIGAIGGAVAGGVFIGQTATQIRGLQTERQATQFFGQTLADATAFGIGAKAGSSAVRGLRIARGTEISGRVRQQIEQARTQSPTVEIVDVRTFPRSSAQQITSVARQRLGTIEIRTTQTSFIDGNRITSGRFRSRVLREGAEIPTELQTGRFRGDLTDATFNVRQPLIADGRAVGDVTLRSARGSVADITAFQGSSIRNFRGGAVAQSLRSGRDFRFVSFEATGSRATPSGVGVGRITESPITPRSLLPTRDNGFAQSIIDARTPRTPRISTPPVAQSLPRTEITPTPTPRGTRPTTVIDIPTTQLSRISAVATRTSSLRGRSVTGTRTRLATATLTASAVRSATSSASETTTANALRSITRQSLRTRETQSSLSGQASVLDSRLRDVSTTTSTTNNPLFARTPARPVDTSTSFGIRPFTLRGTTRGTGSATLERLDRGRATRVATTTGLESAITRGVSLGTDFRVRGTGRVRTPRGFTSSSDLFGTTFRRRRRR